jgi:hypothetical protein
VKDEIHAFDDRMARFPVPDIAFDHPEVVRMLLGKQALKFVQVPLVAGGEIIEPDDLLPAAQERLDQVGADEPGSSGDQPSRLPTSQ